ncbi:MAG: helix-turn-helix domain-containing protein [Methanocorpusculum sp.]|jgi:hypothetical protein|nr:helix-turn-helix domain-containing protein [Methanocorpusculum sp.]
MKHWYEFPELLSREYLEKAVFKRRSASQIARELGCSRYSVYTAARHHGLDLEGIAGQRPLFIRRKTR